MKKIPDHIEQILKNLPQSPGVYQMKDRTNRVIYVGKAKNLRARVASYFRDGKNLTVAKKHMVEKIADIETLLCQTEVEALTLETNLIKHLSPKYNILMKDDKNLSYIKITKGPVPEVIKTRQKLSDGAEYFGPFTQGANITASLKNLRRIFKIRDCRMKFAESNGRLAITDRAGRGVPCMDYYIGICPAPCLLTREHTEAHAKHLARLRSFLKGDTTEVLDHMQQEMMRHAKALEFEKAAKIKTEIEAIQTLSERQIVRDAVEGNHDICVVYEKNEQFFVGLTKIRDAKIIAVMRFVVESRGEWADAVLSQFLARQYVGETEDLPDHIFLASEIDDAALLAFFRDQKIHIEYPKIGVKKELLDFTKNQLREYAYKRELERLEHRTLTRAHMENILKRLGYEIPQKWPIIFECYDISHTHGQFTYASRVVIKNGKSEPSMYKKYKIKTLSRGEIDDFASHEEVMRRRTLEGMEEKNFPHLIIIDGGKGQLSSAMKWVLDGKKCFEEKRKNPPVRGKENFDEIFRGDKNRDENMGNLYDETERKKAPLWNGRGRWELEENRGNVETNTEVSPLLWGEGLGVRWEGLGVRLCSLAKREEEIFVPNKKNPILFEPWSPELMVLQKARDESHRFSLTANRTARTKAMKKNILEELPGIWPTTRKKLLSLAGSVDALTSLSEEEILTVINKKQLETLRDHGIV